MATRTLDRRPIPRPFRLLGWLIVAAVALFMMTGAAVIGAGTYYELTRTKSGDIEDMIKKDLPPGATTDHVISFLDSHSIEHGAAEVYGGGDSRLLEAGIVKGNTMIRAIVRNDGYSLDLVDVEMRFILDDEGKLKSHIVWEVHHRP